MITISDDCIVAGDKYYCYDCDDDQVYLFDKKKVPFESVPGTITMALLRKIGAKRRKINDKSNKI